MRYLILVFAFVLGGCATSRKWKVVETSVYSGLACGLIGSAQAPEDENKTTHGVMWAGLCGAAGALIANEVFDESSEVADLENKNKELHRLITDMKSGNVPNDSRLKAFGYNHFTTDPIPEEFTHMVKPGRWKVITKRKINNSPNMISGAEYDEIVIEPPQILIEGKWKPVGGKNE